MSLESGMSLKLGKIHQGDCLELMSRIDEGSVDLAFADPPFNIGYKYDKYHDRQDDQDYLDWCQRWIGALHRVLKPSGTFWLAIGDEYAAELKWLATRTLREKFDRPNFIMRSWVVWYYTFGVNCTRKFNRSHAHLFQFIKDEKKFTFNAEEPLVRVPSARALVYGDSRANPTGRLPDDTWVMEPAGTTGGKTSGEQADDFFRRVTGEGWVLRPQDAPAAFQSMDDTWYYSRVAGTFKERQGFHGCQMPEQLLGRIIRVSSNEGEVVFDPFAGSGTTLAVAKKLGRQFLGTELSEDYAKYATERLKGIRVGAPLDGPADPASSSPTTANGVTLEARNRRKAGDRGQRPLPLAE
jgi:site-specific DNA-methyltransferase (adenine-specific)